MITMLTTLTAVEYLPIELLVCNKGKLTALLIECSNVCGQKKLEKHEEE